MDELEKTKVGVLFGLLGATLVAGLLPLMCLMRPTSRTKKLVSYSNSFAGGVFLGTLLLHMMPEAAENMSKALDEYHIHTDFAFSEFLVAMGFFLILVAEVLAHMLYRPRDSSDVDDTGNKPAKETDGLIPKSNEDTREDDRTMNTISVEASMEHVLKEPEKSILSYLIFLLALSLHSLFEGMAIGLQDSPKGVLEVFLGVVLHKCVIVFSLALSLVHQRVSPCHIVAYVVLLAIMSPVGIGIGMAITQGTPAATMANGVLQSMASGTFLFIIFFEILPGELVVRDIKPDILLKIVFVIAGFGVMSGLQFVGDEHDD